MQDFDITYIVGDFLLQSVEENFFNSETYYEISFDSKVLRRIIHIGLNPDVYTKVMSVFSDRFSVFVFCELVFTGLIDYDINDADSIHSTVDFLRDESAYERMGENLVTSERIDTIINKILNNPVEINILKEMCVNNIADYFGQDIDLTYVGTANHCVPTQCLFKFFILDANREVTI